MTNTVEPVLDEAFPGRSVADVQPAGVSWNDQNETVAVEFADGASAFLKVAVDGDGSRVARERAVIDYVRSHCDVAVPTVVASDADGDPPYLATAPMDGHNVAEGWPEWDDDEQVAVTRRVGAALAEVHDRTFESHGHIEGGGPDELVLDGGTWTDVLVDEIEAQRARSSTDRFEGYFDEVVAAVEGNRPLLDEAPAVLTHGDPAQPNVFRLDGAIGFVDWEISHVGDPAYELYRAEQQFPHDADERGSSSPDSQARQDAGERIEVALREGYAERAGSLPEGYEDRVPVYEAVWHVYNLGLFDKWAGDDDESPEEVAATAEAEMERYLDAIR
ncbi:phosphotransferase family protein [Halomicrobium salinisoli]|uniref:phosphotransferase family protein n=1 Tax=Halomicrobium salinisoli TaxID=2878391 RepID=UPI001CF007FD|nr:phosphotransferase [Halomicrobium salinisoli]